MTLGDARRMALGLLALTTVATLAVLLPARQAGAAPVAERFSISVFGDAGTTHYTPRRSSISVGQTWDGEDEMIRVRAAHRDGGPEYTFEFATQEGTGGRLRTGFYRWAQWRPFRDQGRPGIDVGDGTLRCDQQHGSFEVRDIARTGPRIDRIWIVFEQQCGGSEFGELRLGYPRTAYDVSARVVVWPSTTTEPGWRSFDVPIKVRRTSKAAITVREPVVVGPYASDFPIRREGCAGDLSRRGCTVTVGFAPTGPGPRHAWLKIRTTAGTTRVSLDATGSLGDTSWEVDYDPEDPYVPDRTYAMDDSASQGSPYEIRSQGWGQEDDGLLYLWHARFGTNGGLEMEEGVTYPYEPDQDPFHMSLSTRGNNACSLSSGWVVLDDVAWVGPDRDLERMDARMHAECQSASPKTIDVRMRFHARGDVRAPRRVSGLRGVRDGRRVRVAWSNPGAGDLAGVVARWYPSRKAPGVPWAGRVARAGLAERARFLAPRKRPVTVAAWTYDETGNLGRRRVVTLLP